MDIDLVTRAQNGDQEAFDGLVLSSGDRLHAIAHRILRDSDRADDATQRALLDIWRQLPRLREPARFEAWSYRVLVRACYAEDRETRRWIPNILAARTVEPASSHVLRCIVTGTAGGVHGTVAQPGRLDRAEPMTRPGHRGMEGSDMDTATFTKWMIGEGPGMAGVVGGAVGEGTYAGKVLDFNPGPSTVIEATYQFNGSKRPFTALVHVEQTGLQAVITGVVTDGWGKGNLVKGEYTEIKCDHDGITTDCWRGTLDIASDPER